MPWCPKCVAEYPSETAACPECGGELVDQLPGLAEAVSPQQSAWVLGAAKSFGAACFTIALIVGLFVVSWHLPVHGSFFWDLMFLGCAALLCGATGFVSGRLDRAGNSLSGVIVGWLVPWAVLCLWSLSREGLSELVIFYTWTLTAVVTGVLGTLIGSQWRHRRDWPRLATFLLLLLALSYFWSAMLDLMLVCRD